MRVPEKTSHIYKSTSHCDIALDVYRDEKTPAKSPVIIWIHGGSLISGSRESFLDKGNRQCAAYLKAGFTVAVPDYRLVPQVKIPDIVEDLSDAYHWLQNEGRVIYGFDPTRISLIGQSAGGYLALMGGQFYNHGHEP